MMKIAIKIAVNIGRLLMAATFIFSGFVKGIDPLGTQYKIPTIWRHCISTGCSRRGAHW